MKDLLVILADLWMTFAGFRYGWRFIRDHHNHLLGLEWLVIGTSGANALVWFLLGANPGSVQADVMYFFDAFSRSFGFTLILVLGLMVVTHRYKPTFAVEVGLFTLATVAGLYLQQFRFPEFHVVPATFYLVVSVLTTVFLAYFCWRVWNVGARPQAVGASLAALAGLGIAMMDDFFPIPGDDKQRTLFYTAALTVWGIELFTFFLAYCALADRNEATGMRPRLGGQQSTARLRTAVR